MTSMQLFFDSLHLQPDNQPNDWMATIKWMINPTMTNDMTNTVYQSTKPRTLEKYLALLCTPTCFVPLCMLTQINPQPVTCLLTGHTTQPTIDGSCNTNQHQSTTPAPFDLRSIHSASATPRPSINTVSLTHPMITRVLPGQLDCPPDHTTQCPNHTPTQLTQYPTYRIAQPMKVCYGMPNIHATNLSALPIIPPSHTPATIPTSAASHDGTHDLQPP